MMYTTARRVAGPGYGYLGSEEQNAEKEFVFGRIHI